MGTTTAERTCKTCKYYVALYTKEKTRFKTISGYCINDKKCARRRRYVCFNGSCCEFWEPCESTSEQNNSIREAIFSMQKQLTQILEILENGN